MLVVHICIEDMVLKIRTSLELEVWLQNSVKEDEDGNGDHTCSSGVVVL